MLHSIEEKIHSFEQYKLPEKAKTEHIRHQRKLNKLGFLTQELSKISEPISLLSKEKKKESATQEADK